MLRDIRTTAVSVVAAAIATTLSATSVTAQAQNSGNAPQPPATSANAATGNAVAGTEQEAASESAPPSDGKVEAKGAAPAQTAAPASNAATPSTTTASPSATGAVPSTNGAVPLTTGAVPATAPGEGPSSATAQTPPAVSAPPTTATAPAATPAPATTQATATPAAPEAPAATSATQPATSPTDTAAQAPPAAPPPNPVIAAARLKLIDTATVSRVNKDDIAAIVAFYAERSEPLWVDSNGFTSKAKSAMDEVRKADDWGLEASAFILPSLHDGQQTPETLGEAEARLSLELLKYARFARGGRVNPASLSRILDLVPPIKDPKDVIADLAQSTTPDAYLRDLHPKHEQFERLRQALLKVRGPAEKTEEAPIDEALKIKLPRGNLIKPGTQHADISLLRQRLKVPAETGANTTFFDAKLVDAVKAFQQAKGLDATGTLNSATRRALNAEGEPKKPESPQAGVQRLLINMERWRWMPESLGRIYVWDNIPEFIARVVKDREVIFKERIIVGLPEWATPVFSANMKTIIFNPSWGMPDGIKTRELLPRLRQAGGGFLFFGGGGGSIIRAYGLRAYRGGREVDPDSVDWGSVDIRQYSFIQPPGGKNPLGIVKFMFPNRHDVYMHDTIERALFAQSVRAYSHGCIRVDNPRKLAAILLAADKGWSPERVAAAIGGGEYTLDKPIPVHVTYFTAVVDDHGRVAGFGDIYGHDSRLWAALTGQALRLEPALETASSDDYVPAVPAAQSTKKKPGPKYSGPVSLEDAITGLFSP